MDAFGYVSVIISVVIGLGLSHLLSGVVELVKARRSVRFYWVHSVWVMLIFVGHIFLWWTMWNLRFIRVWNFFSFLVLLLTPVLLYVSSAFLMPKAEAGTAIDLRDYFYENHSAFFSVNAAFTLLLATNNWMLTGHLSPPLVTAAFAFWFVLLGVSAVVKNTVYHAAVVVVFGLLFFMFIVLFGLRLSGT